MFNWGRVAEHYNATIAPITTAHARDAVALISPILEQKSTKTVLDVGCGSGGFAMAYIQRYPRGFSWQTVVCTDISEEMVEKARHEVTRAAKEVQNETKFEFRVVDAVGMDSVDDGSVQAVVSCFGIFLVPQWEAVLQAVYRVLDSSVPSIFAMMSWNDDDINKLPTDVSHFHKPNLTGENCDTTLRNS